MELGVPKKRNKKKMELGDLKKKNKLEPRGTQREKQKDNVAWRPPKRKTVRTLSMESENNYEKVEPGDHRDHHNKNILKGTPELSGVWRCGDVGMWVGG